MDNIEEQDVDINDEAYILAREIIDLLNKHNNNRGNKKKYYVVKYAIIHIILLFIDMVKSSAGDLVAANEMSCMVRYLTENMVATLENRKK